MTPRVSRFNPTAIWLSVLTVSTAIVGAFVVIGGMSSRLELCVLALLAWAVANLVVIWTLGGRHRVGVRLNNDAVALISRGDDEAARLKLHAAVKGFFPRDVVTMSLYNLGILALREQNIADAIPRFREAVAAASGVRLRHAPDLYSGLARAQLAFALAVTGEIAEAERVAVEMTARRVSPLALAFGTRARATIALRKGLFEEVIQILDDERALLRNALSLHDAVLCEAMRAYAISRASYTYRKASHTSAPIYADDLARAYVRSMLPETEPMLVS